jgi:hypothetical protein
MITGKISVCQINLCQDVQFVTTKIYLKKYIVDLNVFIVSLFGDVFIVSLFGDVFIVSSFNQYRLKTSGFNQKYIIMCSSFFYWIYKTFFKSVIWNLGLKSAF